MADASSLQQLLADIRGHIAAGRKIEAIKLYRDATGAGLAEAKEAVELIEAGKPPKADSNASLGDDLALLAVSDLVAEGRKIEAIKRYREVTGLGLKEAKDAVDAFERRLNPDAVMARDVAMRRTLRFLVLALLILAAAVGLAVALSKP
jgi:ribosomal protein L7/L12